MKKVALYLLLFFCNVVFANKTNLDTISNERLAVKYEIIEDQLKEVRRDQLNYKIEKDLLKETYDNNYQRISLFITLILGVVGVLGYLGIKDINSIKKEYISELSNLKQLQSDVALKFEEFRLSKERYDSELKEILRTNDEQNNKIKVLELKEKISNFFRENQFLQALEFCIVALELVPDDLFLLTQKARLYTRLDKYDDSIITYNKLIELDPSNKSAILDLGEVYLLNNQRQEYEQILKDNRNVFEQKANGKLLEIFNLIIAYQDNDVENLQNKALQQLDLTDQTTKIKRINNWDLYDILIYITKEPDSARKKILLSTIWYINGDANVDTFYLNSGLPKPNTI